MRLLFKMFCLLRKYVHIISKPRGLGDVATNFVLVLYHPFVS